ncbi:MAG: sulfatase-like hydrolase/transferase, partial [Planctomycetota bacterium]
MSTLDYPRRDFLKAIGAGAASLVMQGCASTSERISRRATKSKPNPVISKSNGKSARAGVGPSNGTNIIFILADDLGWSELGCYGNKFNETPNLNKLAREGMKFTDAYAAAPVCSPYRAALMTGQYPARVGITDYLRPNATNHLSTEHITIAKMLKRTGYATGIIGKWHLTGYAKHGVKEFGPNVHGFDETIISENRGIGGG